jgi:hypothetical protein
MNTFARIGLAALISVTALAGASAPAMAWDCIAVSEEGSYGYSYNYDDKGSAIERALNECANRTTSDSTCEIVECE